MSGYFGGGSGGAGGGYVPTQHAGVTQRQFDHLKATQPGFVPDPSRIYSYSNPAKNTADRNWQEKLQVDPTYVWKSSDQKSWNKNCDYGPHNAGPDLDSMLFGKK